MFSIVDRARLARDINLIKVKKLKEVLDSAGKTQVSPSSDLLNTLKPGAAILAAALLGTGAYALYRNHLRAKKKDTESRTATEDKKTSDKLASLSPSKRLLVDNIATTPEIYKNTRRDVNSGLKLSEFNPSQSYSQSNSSIPSMVGKLSISPNNIKGLLSSPSSNNPFSDVKGLANFTSNMMPAIKYTAPESSNDSIRSLTVSPMHKITSKFDTEDYKMSTGNYQNPYHTDNIPVIGLQVRGTFR
jgi:hypothetical protein